MRSNQRNHLSRRSLLKSLGMAPLMLRAAPLFGSEFLFTPESLLANQEHVIPFSDLRLSPRYPAVSPLADVLQLVPPGSDTYVTEKYAVEIEALLHRWSDALRISAQDFAPLADFADPSIQSCSFVATKEIKVRSGPGPHIVKRQFAGQEVAGREGFLKAIQSWLGRPKQIETAEFEIYGLEELASSPLTLRVLIRYDVVATRPEDRREERVGSWSTEWIRDASDQWKARRWDAREETVSELQGPGFVDVTLQAIGGTRSYQAQMLRGVDYWRTVLDGACGIDVYSNNGVAAADYDNDGFDDFYVCQPAGLPNRLYRNRGDGTFEDVTEKAGVGVLDNTACALFADFENRGLQDLLVVCGNGPLLFVNQGNGTFSLKREAFQFARPPQGTFTHAAIADYDRDGRLDIYFCMYMYYLGLDQYHYPIPYYDARNGPPNCLLHNEGNWKFVEKTDAAGLNVENDRYSFACAWGDANSDGLPDLCIANDFGSSQLYRNNGDGTFRSASKEAHVEDVGAGMSACWSDFDNDGKQDIYITSMWEAAGQRVSQQQQFHQKAPENIRGLYQRHARGNALYKNTGNGSFQNLSDQAGVAMGRWSWSADFWDFDHDGYPDLYVTNGYISALNRNDLASFFWRQVVAKSPEDATPSPAYEHGWNAINELIRSDNSWNAFERNVMFANNRDGTFSEVSGTASIDFLEDSRSFALADIDHDGRLEVILKNRNAPQIRIVHNGMKELGNAIAFRLRGTKSNRDAIGAAITVEAGALKQTRYLQAGSGFLAQHSKEVFFGVGDHHEPVRATVRWPSGLSQTLENLPINQRIEIEEGSSTFNAKPFAATPQIYGHSEASPRVEPLPTQVETWLIDPLKASAFSLPDTTGTQRELRDYLGKSLLLLFWGSKSPLCREQLRRLEQHRSELAAKDLNVLAVNVDVGDDIKAARTLAAQERLSYPILFATDEMAGIYNILYSYLFDRRRNIGLPTSFLLDRAGLIVKVYQGQVDPTRLLQDVQSAPATAEARLQKAMPLGGVQYQSAFTRNDFTYGVALFQHGYLDQAAKSFEQVIAAKPDSAEGYYNLGTLNLRRNDFAQARTYLEKTLELRPNYPEAWNNLGMLAAQQGQSDEAVKAFEQSLVLRPDYAVALLNLGNVYRRTGSFSKAEESLRRALELQPQDAEINYSLGMLNAQQNQFDRAAEYLERAVALRRGYPEALNNLGVLFVRTKDYAKAEEQFKTCIGVAPDFDQSYLNLARLYAMQGDKAKAKNVLLELQGKQPENANARRALEAVESLP